MYRDDEAAAVEARSALIAEHKQALAAVPAGASAAIAARTARVAAGTVGSIIGGAIAIVDFASGFGVPTPTRAPSWVRSALIVVWVAFIATYALTYALAQLRYRRAITGPLRESANASDDVDRLRDADPLAPLKRMARIAQAFDYRSVALPLAALVVLVPPSLYYLFAWIQPDVLVVHALSYPNRITPGDVLYLQMLRHVLLPLVVICFGAGRAVRTVATPRRRDALRMHPLNIGLMSIYGVFLASIGTFAGSGALDADWFACVLVALALWLRLPAVFRRVRAEHVVLAEIAGEQAIAPPGWLRWLKAAALMLPFLVIVAFVLELGSVTGEVTCDDTLSCTIYESTFTRSDAYAFEPRARRPRRGRVEVGGERSRVSPHTARRAARLALRHGWRWRTHGSRSAHARRGVTPRASRAAIRLALVIDARRLDHLGRSVGRRGRGAARP